MGAVRATLLVFALTALVRGQSPNVNPLNLTCPPEIIAENENCNCAVECCRPGKPQYGDDIEGTPSFCTDKPFQTSYKVRVNDRVPVQINLRDYCTDQILFSSYIAAQVDKFSMVEFPCTYAAAQCDKFPEKDVIARQECEQGFDMYTKVLNCSANSGFFKSFVYTHTCRDCSKLESIKDKAACQRNMTANGLVWEEGHEPIGKQGEMPAIIGACNCNYTQAILEKASKAKLAKDRKIYTLPRQLLLAKEYDIRDLQNLSVGVPDGFMKEGMSTFYIEVVFGGRSTAERGSDTECQCKGPTDQSAACLCELGTKKIPYMLNNSYIPQLTALITVKKGQLFFINTGIKWNFDSSNKDRCLGCTPDYCYGIPRTRPEGDEAFDQMKLQFDELWRRTDFDLKLKTGVICAVPMEPQKISPDYYCRMPTVQDEINRCLSLTPQNLSLLHTFKLSDISEI